MFILFILHLEIAVGRITLILSITPNRGLDISCQVHLTALTLHLLFQFYAWHIIADCIARAVDSSCKIPFNVLGSLSKKVKKAKYGGKVIILIGIVSLIALLVRVFGKGSLGQGAKKGCLLERTAAITQEKKEA